MTDIQLKIEGMKALSDRLGDVEAARFVALIGRENFDYTEWRRGQWNDLSVDGFFSLIDSTNAEPDQY